MRINSTVTAGVIVDVQDRLFPHIHEHEQVASKIKTLIRGLRMMELPLLLTQQYSKGLGDTVADIREEVSDLEHIEKKRFSCCGVSEFDRQISDSSVKNVILMGVETHVCVLQTTLDLLAGGYQPVVVADAVSSRNQNDHLIALERIKAEGGLVTSVESILFELTATADSPHFKEMSRLVK